MITSGHVLASPPGFPKTSLFFQFFSFSLRKKEEKLPIRNFLYEETVHVGGSGTRERVVFLEG